MGCSKKRVQPPSKQLTGNRLVLVVYRFKRNEGKAFPFDLSKSSFFRHDSIQTNIPQEVQIMVLFLPPLQNKRQFKLSY